ncbi:hypothetical protein ACMAUO_17095 [Gluconacetobacter sp. Hr-1-5]|uniref:hypothetical protein n=1 Tax=Gluconacetobacter sp. Hr-1-5 TaxID=3395370 RepID=UPI003B529329
MAIASSIDDYALESVPVEARKSWIHLAWSTTGIVTTLIAVFIGALTTFVAGFYIALLASLIVALVGGSFGWAVGHVACVTGLSSTVIARDHGFARRGAMLPALLFSCMMIGFLAMENLLLYHGLLFFFDRPDTIWIRFSICGMMALAWIVLTTYGFKIVTCTSSVSQILFLISLSMIIVSIVDKSKLPFAVMVAFPSQLPQKMLGAMAINSNSDKLIFCINLMIGQAGALALVDADLGRYARRSRDIGIAAFLGVGANALMVALGGIIMYAGMPTLVTYFEKSGHVSADAAQAMAIRSPDQIVAAFIVFGGVIGTLLMICAQLKAQVLNSYSSSLSLANLFDTLFGVRPGRLAFVVFANIIALVLVFGNSLEIFEKFLAFFGIVSTCIATLMVADFVLTNALGGRAPTRWDVNWLGIFSFILGVVTGLIAPTRFDRIPFISAVAVTSIVYSGLRIFEFFRRARRNATVR